MLVYHAYVSVCVCECTNVGTHGYVCSTHDVCHVALCHGLYINTVHIPQSLSAHNQGGNSCAPPTLPNFIYL